MLALLAQVLPVCAQAQERPQDRPPPGVEVDFKANGRALPQRPTPLPGPLAIEVARAESIGAAIADAEQKPAAADVVIAGEAFKASQFADLDLCEGAKYRAVALPAQDPASLRVVYLLVEPEARTLIIGRHFELGVSDDGSRILKSRPSSVSCLQIPFAAGGGNVIHVSHHLSCAPDAFHVYSSRQYPVPIYVSTSVGLWKLVDGRLALLSPRALPCAAGRLPEVENRWVAIPQRDAGAETPLYFIVFPYFDPDAGFSVFLGAVAEVGATGELRLKYRNNGQSSDRMRMNANQFVHALSEADRERFGLPALPAWLSAYRSGADPVALRVRRGAAYNAILEPRLALAELLPAREERPDQPGLAYELAYAYNETGQFDKALAIAQPAFARAPTDSMLCKEVGFAYLHGKKYDQAGAVLRQCFDLVPNRMPQFKGELAAQAALASGGAGDQAQCLAWLDAAERWLSDTSGPSRSLKAQPRADICEPSRSRR